MTKFYNLSLSKDIWIGSEFLCLSVTGFGDLWDKWVAGKEEWQRYAPATLARALSQYPSVEILGIHGCIADEVRSRVKSMVPCKMSVEDFDNIVNEEITKYKEDYLGL